MPKGGERVRSRRALVVRGGLALSLVVAVGGVAFAAARSDDGATSVRTAASRDSAEPDLSVTTVPVVTAPPFTVVLPTPAVSLPPVTLPPVTVPRVTLPPRLLPPATVPPPAPRPQPLSGADCGTPSGYGGYGATRTASSGGTEATVEVYQCHLYDNVSLQSWVHIRVPAGTVDSVHMDYGDGTVQDWPGSYTCASANRPNPYEQSNGARNYAVPGRYTVTAAVTTTDCASGTKSTVTVTIPVFREAGPYHSG
jgi:hypothetical protein